MKRKAIRTTCWLIATVLVCTLGWFLTKEPNQQAKSDEVSHLGPLQLPSSPSPISLSRKQETTGEAKKKKATTALTAEEIETLGIEFRVNEDEATRRRAFDRLLAGLSKGNVSLIREELSHLPRHGQELCEFHQTWGRVAGKSAVLNAATLSKEATASTLAGWTSIEPAAAREFFEGLQVSAHNGDGSTNHFSQDYLRVGFTQGLAKSDVRLATDFVQLQFDSKTVGEKKAGDMIRAVAHQVLTDQGLADVGAWVATVPGPLRSEALAGIARDRAGTDPQATLDWLGSLDNDTHQGAAHYHTFDTWLGNDLTAASEYIAQMPESYQRDEAISGLAQRTIREDPSAALEWTDAISAPSSRHRVLSETFNSWARVDPVAASAHLAEMPISPERDQAINGFASRISKDDPSAAVVWADQIADTQLRNTALTTVALTTVALSYLESNPDAAKAWLPDSGLSQEMMDRVLDPSPNDLHQMKFFSP
ncbi:MAG: hypothetical protein ACI957_004908 [Verrucomicrobiales bacterium]|jgi:hypothetical protein